MEMLDEAARLQGGRPDDRNAEARELERLLEKLRNEERELSRVGHGHHHDADVMHDVRKQLDQLRNEVGRLRGEVDEMRKNR